MSEENTVTEEKTIYDLKLHECLSVGDDGLIGVMRVPGGWMYEINYTNQNTTGGTNHVFVPLIEVNGVPIVCEEDYQLGK